MESALLVLINESACGGLVKGQVFQETVRPLRRQYTMASVG